MHFIQKYPLLLLHMAGWTIYVVGDFVAHIMSGYYVIIPSLGGGISACILTGLVAQASHKVNGQRKLVQLLVFAIALYVATVLWHKVGIILHYGDGLQQVLNFSTKQWLKPESYSLFLLLTWAGFYISSKMYVQKRYQQNALQQAELRTKQAQLQTLRYQLNPHFLFNVLNSLDVSMLSNDNKTARQMLKHLCGFLRHSLMPGERGKITLQQEFSIVSDFIHIEQIRFGNALKITQRLAEDCEQALIPPLLLQPLMENAIKFAWHQQQQGKVTLAVTKVGQQQLRITIHNNKLATNQHVTGTGTGLRNIRERLQLMYDNKAQLEVRDLVDTFELEIVIPWETSID